jgi:hypothetical protein
LTNSLLLAKKNGSESIALIKDSPAGIWKSIRLLLIISCCFTIGFFILLTSFRKINQEPGSTMIIQFEVNVHGTPLQLNKKYKNPFGENFEISRFRFYAGKIAPIYTDAGIKMKPSAAYYLIDFSDSASTIIEIPIKPGSCNEIQFQLGIDSIDQMQGAQTGVLDPVKGMFWTWNSGYLSFKIEGVSPESDQPAHMIAYHIGGYRYPYSSVWKFRIGTDKLISISKGDKIMVKIPIELDHFFDGPNPLHIKEISDCTTPGELARKISENFIGSFSEGAFNINP